MSATIINVTVPSLSIVALFVMSLVCVGDAGCPSEPTSWDPAHISLSKEAKAARLATYFNYTAYYFGVDQIPRQLEGEHGVSRDPYQCLDQQRKMRWRGRRFHSSPPPVIELVGIEGSGHHAVHTLLGNCNETGHRYLRWRGASWPVGAQWRKENLGPDGMSSAFEANFRSRPMKDLDNTVFKGLSADFYIVLVRSPGSCAASAVRRFARPRLHDLIGPNPVKTRELISRDLQVQQDTQFENMVLLSSYINILPCERTLFMPLELLMENPQVAAEALVEALGTLLDNPDAVLQFARNYTPTATLVAQRTHQKGNEVPPAARSRKLSPETGQVVAGTMALNPLLPATLIPATASKRENVTPALTSRRGISPLEMKVEEQLTQKTVPQLENYYLRYRALWPLLAPGRAFLEDRNQLDQHGFLAKKVSPPWWPRLCCSYQKTAGF